MQLLLTLQSALQVLYPNTATSGGARDVRRAVTELDTINSQTFEVELGEPHIEDAGGEFFSDPKVVVPIVSTPIGNPGSLIFDVPPSRDETGDSQLWAFLSALDISTIDNVDAVEGCRAPVRYVGGSPLVMWDELLDEPADFADPNDDADV